MITDCLNNRGELFSDGSPVFGVNECLVSNHAVAADNECYSSCNGDDTCVSTCPVQSCMTACESSCLDYSTDSAFGDLCRAGCMNSCFEFKGSDHTCSGLANCGYFGSDPVCIADGNCQFDASHTECYNAFQIGCKIMGINIYAQNSGALPQDDSNTENEAPVECPSICRTKCIALQVWIKKSKPQTA